MPLPSWVPPDPLNVLGSSLTQQDMSRGEELSARFGAHVSRLKPGVEMTTDESSRSNAA